MSGTKVQPFLLPSSPYIVVNPPPPPPFPSLPTPTPLTSAQSSMSSSPTGEEKYLPLTLNIKFIIAMPIIVFLIFLMLRKCSSRSGSHINGGSGSIQNQINIQLPVVNTDDNSGVSVTV